MNSKQDDTMLGKETNIDHHALEPKNRKLVSCKFCMKELSPSYIREHQINCVKNPTFDKTKPVCGLCGRSFSRKKSLAIHLKSCSNSSGNSRKKIPCMFENCTFVCFFRYGLIEHLNEIHKCDIDTVQKYKFDSFDDFLSWKDNEEQRTFSYFSKKCGELSGKTYYYCQHDGSDRPHRKSTEQNRKTNRRHNKGVMKIGRHCIAMMRVFRTPGGKFELNYYSTHSHPLDIEDLRHHPQSVATYDFIDTQLALGVSPSKIVEDLRDSLQSGDFEEEIPVTKASFVTKRLVRERARSRVKALQKRTALQEIFDRHEKGMNIPDDSVKYMTEKASWQVSAYLVSKYQDECTNEQCIYKCKSPSCGSLCIHMYECTCQDQHPLCKHIHKVHSLVSQEVESEDTNKNAVMDSSYEQRIFKGLETNLHTLLLSIKSASMPYSLAVQLNTVLGQFVESLQEFSESVNNEVPEL